MGKNSQLEKTRDRRGVKSSLLREFSSGGVVYKKQNDEVLWLIGKSTPSEKFPGEYWRLPKGWIDDAEGGLHPGPISSGEVRATEDELQKGALREVREEVGVSAKIISKIPTSKYITNSSRGRVIKFVTYYLMEWVSDLPEGFGFETTEIKWLPFDEAYKMLNSSNEKEILKKASNILASVA